MGYIALLVGAFLLGAIPFGYLIGKVHGIDVRTKGSGNSGASNVLRTIGYLAAVLVLLLDVFKASVAVWAALDLGYALPLAVWVGVAAVVGHNWSPFLGWRGGRGIASSLGVLIAGAPPAAVVGLGVWVIVVLLTRYISLGSLLATALVPLYLITVGEPFPIVAATIVLFALAVYRHIPNIQRLRAGTENRFGQKAK